MARYVNRPYQLSDPWWTDLWWHSDAASRGHEEARLRALVRAADSSQDGAREQLDAFRSHVLTLHRFVRTFEPDDEISLEGLAALYRRWSDVRDRAMVRTLLATADVIPEDEAGSPPSEPEDE